MHDRLGDIFGGENAASMPVGEQASVMLLSHTRFGELSTLPAADATMPAQASAETQETTVAA